MSSTLSTAQKLENRISRKKNSISKLRADKRRAEVLSKRLQRHEEVEQSLINEVNNFGK